MSGDEVLELGEGVVIRGAAMAETRHLLKLGARELRRRDATGLSPSMRRLIEYLDRRVAEATSHQASTDAMSRHDDARLPADPPRSRRGSSREAVLSSRQVAKQIGRDVRHVQRLASLLGARRTARGDYEFDQSAVDAYLERRDAADA